MAAAPIIPAVAPLAFALVLLAAWLLLKRRRPALGRVARDLAGARDEAEMYAAAFRWN